MKFVEDGSRLIASNLNDQLENNKIVRTAQLEELFQRTTRKLEELTCLDVSCGCWMRNETMLLNDEIRRSFDTLERSIVSNTKEVTSMLDDLHRAVLTSAARADKSVVLCREHLVPVELTNCVNERLDIAMLMLNRMSKEARLKLTGIEKFCETVVTAYEMTAREVMESNYRKSAELSKYLDRCIAKLREAS